VNEPSVLDEAVGDIPRVDSQVHELYTKHANNQSYRLAKRNRLQTLT
jgi:hypothetical protein